MSADGAIQETYWPEGICFGCGPSNDKGLHIRSFVEEERVVARWTPQKHHQAFPGILNGGIIGTLLDCHSNAAAWWTLSNAGAESGPTVTAAYSVELLRPTPVDRELTLVAEVVDTSGRKAVVEARIEVDDDITAKCRGTFVKPRPEKAPPL